MNTTQFIILDSGDIININDILYVHPSKQHENAYLYIRELYHGAQYKTDKDGHKRIDITLKDYDILREYLPIINNNHKYS